MSKFGFIGVGNMGSALAKAVSKKVSAENILLSDYSKERAENFAKEIGACATDNQTVAKEADYIFLGVKPQVINSVLSELCDVFSNRNSRFVIVTMAAGVEISKIEEALNKTYPIIRIMPNTPACIGEGMILYSPNSEVLENEKNEFLEAMSLCGKLLQLDEKLINAATAVSGCGPAYVDLFIEAMSDGAVACGLPRNIALELSAQTVKGSAALVQELKKSPAELKDAVCSPGGTTIQGVRALEESAFRGAVMNAVIAAYEKSFKL